MNEHSELVRLLRSISDDLTTMLRIKPILGATGNCAAPIALYSLTSMSFIGYLISPEELSEHEHIQRIMACVEYGGFGVELTTGIVTELYNGLISSFIPSSLGVGREFEDLPISHIISHTPEAVAINVDGLARMLVWFICGLEGIMMVDGDLCAVMWKRLMSLTK